jgi:hypothetical protein
MSQHKLINLIQLIPINSGDGLTLRCKNYLYIKGTVTKADGTSEIANYKLTNNFLAYLIDIARYEINGVEISSVRNVGATSKLLSYATMKSGKEKGF